jgi:hypothetical protein
LGFYVFNVEATKCRRGILDYIWCASVVLSHIGESVNIAQLLVQHGFTFPLWKLPALAASI